MSSADMNAEKEALEEAIFKRLKDWVQRNLLDEDSMRYLKHVVKTFLGSECNAPKSTDEKSCLYTGEDGWYCGLTQMLDLKTDIICKTLPYILTAYMYNYNIPKKKFVREFASKEKDTIDEDEFFGIKLHEACNKNPSGIENLLAGLYTIQGNSELKVLKRLAQCFTFSGVAVYGWDPEKEGKGVHVRGYFDQRYVIPTADGYDINMAAAKQRIAFTEIKGEDALPPLGDDCFIYGAPRAFSSIEDELDRLCRDLGNLYEKAKQARSEEEMRKMKEQFFCLHYTLSRSKDAVSNLQTRVDKLDNAFEDLAKKYRWKRRKYTEPENLAPEERKSFSGGMSLNAVLNIFATWYHIWKEMYRSSYMACRVDPVLCVLLLKATLPEKETAPFEDFKQALTQMSQEEARCFVDDLIEERYYEFTRKKPGHIKMIPSHWTLDEFMAFFPMLKYPIPN